MNIHDNTHITYVVTHTFAFMVTHILTHPFEIKTQTYNIGVRPGFCGLSLWDGFMCFGGFGENTGPKFVKGTGIARE